MLHAAGSPAIAKVRVSMAPASGTLAQSSEGSPMFTDTRRPDSRTQVSKPRSVRSTIEWLPVSCIKRSATPRVALPQAASGVPSAFQNLTRAAASSQSSTTAN